MSVICCWLVLLIYQITDILLKYGLRRQSVCLRQRISQKPFSMHATRTDNTHWHFTGQSVILPLISNTKEAETNPSDRWKRIHITDRRFRKSLRGVPALFLHIFKIGLEHINHYVLCVVSRSGCSCVVLNTPVPLSHQPLCPWGLDDPLALVSTVCLVPLALICSCHPCSQLSLLHQQLRQTLKECTPIGWELVQKKGKTPRSMKMVRFVAQHLGTELRLTNTERLPRWENGLICPFLSSAFSDIIK